MKRASAAVSTLVGAAMICTASVSLAQLFEPRVDYELAGLSHSLVVADFDADGARDVAVADSHVAGTTFSVFRNRDAGDGSLTIPADVYTTGTEPNSILTADLDGDGFPDLATANQASNDVRAFRNLGDGTFEFLWGSGFVGILRPEALAAADLDGRNGIDLAFSAFTSDKVITLLNDGSGFFSANGSYDADDGPTAMVAADLDGVNRPDLAVACSNSDQLRVFLNRGDGVFDFDSVIDVSVSGEPTALTAADLDADGDQDLVLAGGTSDSVAVLLNDGDAGFSVVTLTSDDLVGPGGVAAADLNCDGALDLAVTDVGSDQVSVFLNLRKPRGMFRLERSYTVGLDPTSVAAADLNRDGAPDLVVADHTGHTLSILMNVGCGPVYVRVCRAAKLRAVGKNAKTTLACHASAAKQNTAVDPACLGKAQAQFGSAFTKAEAKGACATTEDATAIAFLAKGFADDVADDLRPTQGGTKANQCASAKLKAAGKSAGGLLDCHQRAARKGLAVDPTCLSAAHAKLTSAFSRAENQGGCATSDDAMATGAKVEALVTATVARL